jgi:uroporphyrinogen-III decarboxylase
MVYRRMRVKEVFAEDSADWQKSLNWQLGALQQSMGYKADIPNFLEPWYGIGTIASAFGFGYRWEQGQAPALDGKFEQLEHLLQADFKPVAQTAIGSHSLEMTEYFLEQTRGRLPMSWCDVQSPLNILCNLVDSNMFFPEFYLNPEAVEQALE